MCADAKAASRAELVARRFGARASQYDRHALLQRQTAQRLAALITQRAVLPSQGLVAEIGCGTGLLTELLAPACQRYLAIDIAPEMLDICRQLMQTFPQVRFNAQDGEQATFPEPPSLVASNLTAQWFQNPAAGLARLAEQTEALAFSIPLAGSFPEWEQAFAELGRASGLLQLPAEADIRAALSALPGRTTLFTIERHAIRYDSARAFADSFRRIGADTPRPGYRPSPIKPILERFAEGIEATALILYGLVGKEAK